MKRIFDACNRVPVVGQCVFSRILGHYIPFTGAIGAIVREMGDGCATVELPDRRPVRNHLDSIHAIALASLGELTTGLAVHSGIPAKGRGILKTLKVDYRKKARGTLTARCSTVSPTTPGRHEAEAVAEIQDAKGQVVAVVTGLWIIDV